MELTMMVVIVAIATPVALKLEKCLKSVVEAYARMNGRVFA